LGRTRRPTTTTTRSLLPSARESYTTTAQRTCETVGMPHAHTPFDGHCHDGTGNLASPEANVLAKTPASRLPEPRGGRPRRKREPERPRGSPSASRAEGSDLSHERRQRVADVHALERLVGASLGRLQQRVLRIRIAQAAAHRHIGDVRHVDVSMGVSGRPNAVSHGLVDQVVCRVVAVKVAVRIVVIGTARRAGRDE